MAFLTGENPSTPHPPTGTTGDAVVLPSKAVWRWARDLPPDRAH